MKTSSAKAKGRRLQQQVRDLLRTIGKPRGLVAEDIESRGMGQNGVDLILSPAAKKVFNLSIECKNVEKLNVITTFKEHHDKYVGDKSLKLLVHSRNNSATLVTMNLLDFLELLEKGLPSILSES